eukprot:CAMPEP_0201280992 /NCGR_PEP_ID=MMETSP1317-20130820/657_1 /ASSEMBLY_ACC=CAM_ASM_000770 /TAXON_ID=187299 /ORGANISM="Undescribed Undescribed, Strain Undescribed" /LENGTH=30 /DNA_ID= /DNA_START= /DNA_END= /DNA_ORIENTATION=
MKAALVTRRGGAAHPTQAEIDYATFIIINI